MTPLSQPPISDSNSATASNSGTEVIPNCPLILLAEDNPDNIQVIQDYLIHAGYELIIALNGLEALSLAKTQQPQIILMDIQMPEMDGLEAIRQLQSDAQLSKIPIIALTALAMDGDRERCLEAGASDYLSKPFSLKKLKALLERWLGPERKSEP